MSRGWTEERKQRQRERVLAWRPWEKSTGPRTVDGKAKVARNAYDGAMWLVLRSLSVKVSGVIRGLKAAGNWPPR